VFNDIIRALTGEGSTRLIDGEERLRLAVAVLLVTAAQADDQFEATERSTIGRLLGGRFNLSREDVERLIRSAQQRAEQSPGVYRFVKDVVEHSSPKERVLLIEMLWDIAYADRNLSPDEDALIRRIAGLVHVSDFERGEAHRRAAKRLALKA
jgi:uncharacterized tellurite resistance protein B-like protein